MLCVNDGLFIKLIESSSALVTVILLLLAECRGQSLGVGPAQTIVTLLGEDVTLPCHLEPAADVFSKSVEWGRPDLEPRFVHVWHEGKNFLVSQNPSYKGRTSLSIENLRQGDLSLRLSAVKLSDNGMYRCYFPSQDKTSTVELVVGSVSSPVIAGINIDSSRVILQCESIGWYPEPEVVWLDGEGNLLSAGPTETVRGPDDLYTVSSRVTVEKRHSNNFTCRVQQKDINQTRETHIYVPVQSPKWILIIGTPVCIIVLLIIPLIICTKRRQRTGIKLEGDVNVNAAQLQPLVERNQQQEDQREQLDRVQRSQSEETSAAGNNTEDSLKHRETQR